MDEMLRFACWRVVSSSCPPQQAQWESFRHWWQGCAAARERTAASNPGVLVTRTAAAVRQATKRSQGRLMRDSRQNGRDASSADTLYHIRCRQKESNRFSFCQPKVGVLPRNRDPLEPRSGEPRAKEVRG